MDLRDHVLNSVKLVDQIFTLMHLVLATLLQPRSKKSSSGSLKNGQLGRASKAAKAAKALEVQQDSVQHEPHCSEPVPTKNGVHLRVLVRVKSVVLIEYTALLHHFKPTCT